MVVSGEGRMCSWGYVLLYSGGNVVNSWVANPKGTKIQKTSTNHQSPCPDSGIWKSRNRSNERRRMMRSQFSVTLRKGTMAEVRI
jgi:hypothetical protein